MRWRIATACGGVLLCIISAAGCRARPETGGAPATRKAPVTDTYHGVQLVDDYRWLEDWNSPEVRDWSDAQNAYARSILDKLESRDAIQARVAELRSVQADSYFRLTWRNDKLFALKRQPPKQQHFLIVMGSPDAAAGATTLVDPNVLDSSGGTTIDFYEPSWDGKYIAVSLSKGGSESGDVHIYDATGKEVFEVVPRVQGGTAGGDVAWNRDGSGFYYTRYPHEGERPTEDLAFYQQVYFHKLGTSPDTDHYELGRELPKVAEIRVDAHPRRDYLLSSVQHGDGGGIEQYLRTPDGKWQRLSAIADEVAKVEFGPDDDLFLVSTKDATRGKILRMRLADPRLEQAQTVVAEGEHVILSDFWESGPGPIVTGTRLFVPYQTGGPMDLRAFDLRGQPQAAPRLLPVSAVSATSRLGDDLLFLSVSFTTPPAWYRFTPQDGSTTRTSLARTAPFGFDDAEVIQEFATSKDGTQVPYMVIRPKGSAGRNLPMMSRVTAAMASVSRLPSIR